MTGSSPSWSIQQPRWVSRGLPEVPAGGGGGAVAAGVGAGGVLRCRPAGGLVQGGISGPCLGGRPMAPGESGWFRQPQDSVGAQAGRGVDGQVGQYVGEPGDVVAGVGDDQDGRVARAPLPDRGSGGQSRRGAGRRSPRWRHRPGRVGPRPTARSTMSGPARGRRRTGTGRPGISWAWPLPRPSTWQNSRSGLAQRVRAQPRADVDGEHDPPIGGPGQRPRCQRLCGSAAAATSP